MDMTPDIEEAKQLLLNIVKERDELRTELAHAKTTIIELENQNSEFDRLLSNAYSQLFECNPKRFVKLATSAWIGTWQSSPKHYPEFVPIEVAWENGHLQQALNQMPAMLERQDFDVNHRVNARLLYSAMIQSSGNYKRALQYAEEALQVAWEARLNELACKAQFHRGLCYYLLSEYANARWCFILASHLDDHAQTIKECREKAEKAVEALDQGNPKRSVAPGFKFFCHSVTDYFIYNESSRIPRLIYS